jgi:hypothetical protein
MTGGNAAMERPELEPGQWVRHPGQPGWGPGQVQSAVGFRVTVMFQDAGKVLIDTTVVALRLLSGPDDT